MTAPTPDPVALATSALDEAIAAISGAGGSGAPATGQSADGLVEATLGEDGSLAQLRADPRALRGSADEFAARIVAAFNAARDAAPEPDPEQRRERLRAAQENSQKAMTSLRGALQDTLRRVVTEAGGQY